MHSTGLSVRMVARDLGKIRRLSVWLERATSAATTIPICVLRGKRATLWWKIRVDATSLTLAPSRDPDNYALAGGDPVLIDWPRCVSCDVLPGGLDGFAIPINFHKPARFVARLLISVEESRIFVACCGIWDTQGCDTHHFVSSPATNADGWINDFPFCEGTVLVHLSADVPFCVRVER